MTYFCTKISVGTKKVWIYASMRTISFLAPALKLLQFMIESLLYLNQLLRSSPHNGWSLKAFLFIFMVESRFVKGHRWLCPLMMGGTVLRLLGRNIMRHIIWYSNIVYNEGQKQAHKKCKINNDLTFLMRSTMLTYTRLSKMFTLSDIVWRSV